MNVPFTLSSASVLFCALVATGLAQNLPAIPPSTDPSFWGRANAPYTSDLTVTVSGTNTAQAHVSVEKECRDSAGRVRTDSFYDSGLPMSVMLRDPVKGTTTSMMVVSKSGFITPLHRPVNPPPGTWIVEQLPSRVIDGLPAEGFRFTRTIPANTNVNVPPDTLSEEDWISNSLGVVLERKIERKNMTTTYEVSQLKQVEPDPSLFVVPPDYSIRQVGPQAQRP